MSEDDDFGTRGCANRPHKTLVGGAMTMDHALAERTQAAERYLLGQMAEFERDQYEEHFFSCEECAEEVRLTAAFLESARPHVTGSLQAAAAANTRWPALARLSTAWARMKPLFWPMPAGIAAAAVLMLAVTGYQMAVVVPNLALEVQQAQRIQTAPWYFLSSSRSEAAVVTAADQDRWAGLTLSRSFDRPFPFYRCEIRDAEGRLVLTEVVPGPPAGDELQILLPLANLTPGVYAVAVAGLESATSQAAQSEYARYQFTFRRDDRVTAGSPDRP